MTNHSKLFGGISGCTLKMIAIITMFIDHTGAIVLRSLLNDPAFTVDFERQAFVSSLYNLSRDIGRLAFPIFCFLIVEGFLHTRNVKRYAERLALFAVISEIFPCVVISFPACSTTFNHRAIVSAISGFLLFNSLPQLR